jgi:hypothetical protein
MKTTEFAELAMPRLIWLARRGETTTYGELAASIPGWTSGVARLGAQMRSVQALCSKRGLPDLTPLVVTQATGEPATGEAAAAQDKVFREFQRLGLHADLPETEPVA